MKAKELTEDEKYLQQLISQGEGLNLDFKFAISDSRKIARSIVAFANAEGGKLLIGVKDNGVVAGIRSDEEIYMIDTALLMFCKPHIETKQKVLNYLGKEVLEVKVSKQSGERLCTVKEENGRDMVYVRMKDSNQLVNRIWLRTWARKKSKKPAITKLNDSELIFLRLMSDMKMRSLDEISQKTKLKKRLVENFIIKFGVLDLIKINFTSAGVLYSHSDKFENFELENYKE